MKDYFFVKQIIIVFIFYTQSIHSQNDTLFAKDTIISSVRIMNHDDAVLRYFYLDSTNNKKTETIALEKVNRISFENKTIEVFCDLITKKKFLGTKETISVNYGNRDSLWLDPKIYTLVAKELKEYNSIIDALNYMGHEGWKTLSSYSTSHNSYIVEHYILKKEIKK